jgi:hypothetical protein
MTADRPNFTGVLELRGQTRAILQCTRYRGAMPIFDVTNGITLRDPAQGGQWTSVRNAG